MASVLSCSSLCRVWHLCNLPCAYTFFWLISIAIYHYVLSLQVLALHGLNWNIPWTCWLLAFYAVKLGTAIWLELFARMAVCCLFSQISYQSLSSFSSDCHSFTLRKLMINVFLGTFLCSLHQFDQAHLKEKQHLIWDEIVLFYVHT